jgi:hypothetical protein
MKNPSKASIKRLEKRNSIETQRFKLAVEAFLKDTDAIDQVVYSIKYDLSRMTNQPFYGIKLRKPSAKRDNDAVLTEYISLLIKYNDLAFAEYLLKSLNRQQQALLRKIAPKVKDPRLMEEPQWEHAIPTKYIVSELFKMVQNRDITGLSDLISIYKKAGQRKVSKITHRKVDAIHRDDMPQDWRWQEGTSNYLVRYCLAGVISEIALSSEEKDMVAGWLIP